METGVFTLLPSAEYTKMDLMRSSDESAIREVSLAGLGDKTSSCDFYYKHIALPTNKEG